MATSTPRRGHKETNLDSAHRHLRQDDVLEFAEERVGLEGVAIALQHGVGGQEGSV